MTSFLSEPKSSYQPPARHTLAGCSSPASSGPMGREPRLLCVRAQREEGWQADSRLSEKEMQTREPTHPATTHQCSEAQWQPGKPWRSLPAGLGAVPARVHPHGEALGEVGRVRALCSVLGWASPGYHKGYPKELPSAFCFTRKLPSKAWTSWNMSVGWDREEGRGGFCSHRL